MRYSKSQLIIILSLLSVSFSGSFANPNSYNVDAYGAKGDGASDSTKAFQAAWQVACGSDLAAEVYVPKGEYLLQPVTFEGKCKCPQLTVWIDGWLVGPHDYMVIANAGRWIQFSQVDNLVIQGGTLLGRGQYLFNCNATYNRDPNCPYGGTMLTFAKSSNVWVNNLTLVNSQGFHVVVEDSKNINFFGINITAPENSPNTDGIHIRTTTGVTITSSLFQTGDDCVSLSHGSQNILIQKVWCGPGHGISIGSLGSGPGEAEVRNVTVKDVRFEGTQNGFRIKTWAKPYEVIVDDIHFVNAVMKDVNNPVIIDQYYCPRGGCPIEKSYAKISNVEFNNIYGTSTLEVAIKFDCNPKFPCTGLSVQNVKLTHWPEPAQSEVKNAAVKTIGVVEPAIRFN